MSVAKEALGLNKGEFKKKVKTVIDSHRANSRLLGKPKDFVLTCCRLTDRFSKMANEPGIEVYLRNMKIGPRSVKCLHLKRKDFVENVLARACPCSVLLFQSARGKIDH